MLPLDLKYFFERALKEVSIDYLYTSISPAWVASHACYISILSSLEVLIPQQLFVTDGEKIRGNYLEITYQINK